jgi:hypothetical protein
VITNFAGTISSGYSGDGGLAIAAKLNSPKDVVADGWGRVYIADYDNNVIRVVASTVINGVADVPAKQLQVYPNPSQGSIVVDLAAITGEPTVTIMDVAGKIVDTKTVTGTKNSITFNNLSSGTYIIKLTDGNIIYREMVTVIK